MQMQNNYNPDYDSIHLIPNGISELNHRSEVSMVSDFHGLFPIISSPMRGISGSDLVIAMGQNNCLGVLHRFDTIENRIHSIHKIKDSGVRFAVAIGVNNEIEELDCAMCAYENGTKMIVVDIANGYIESIGKLGMKLKKMLGNDFSLMGGNVITKEGVSYLVDHGFDFIRIGIGNGGLCSTRDMTGIGRNQLKALQECSYHNIYDNINLVSDGGISKPGNAVKSFAFGSDFVMLGSVLAYANESENNGTIMGMASKLNHLESNKEIKSIEGKEQNIDVNKKVPLKEILDQFLWSIKSSCTYLGAKSYTEIKDKCDAEYTDGRKLHFYE